MGMYYTKWAEKAVRLGATVEDGMNWTWANGFPTEAAAQEFMAEEPEMETRGIYPEKGGTFAVRFRVG